MQLTFSKLNRLAPRLAAGTHVEIDGWLHAFGQEAPPGYCALVEEPACCGVCLPRDVERRIEVLAVGELPANATAVRATGRLHVLENDEAGWRYQLRDARVRAQAAPRPLAIGRRGFVAAPLACVALGTTGVAAQTSVSDAQARAAIADAVTIDVHSHGGGVIGVNRIRQRLPFVPLAAPMRQGGMAVVCLAMVADSPAIQVSEGRIRPYRDPSPGELHDFAQLSFQRLHDIAREQSLRIIGSSSELRAARSSAPGIIVSAEGADFLEGQAARLTEAHGKWRLRHLQLTHYRVNELGDIQTESTVHGGLSAFGREIIGLCNRLGIVVDVAHGTLDLVKQAARITTRALVLSHTSLGTQLGSRSRLITPEHAKVIAGTGGVIGIWPPTTIFADMTAYAAGIARVAETVGVDHVGIGSDMGGLVGASAFPGYEQTPALAAALLARGFKTEDVRKLLGGNYARVFAQSVA